MSGRILRSGLFGFRKADVYNYICELDEKAEARIREKDGEIAELKARLDELQKNRDAVVSVLQTAEKNARDIVSRANESAEELLRKTENEMNEKKGIVNREIEVKRRAIKSYYAAENKKLAQIKSEVEKMREASIAAIKRFESELLVVESMGKNSELHSQYAMEYGEGVELPKPFENVERIINVRTIAAKKNSDSETA